jgi:5-methylcytosine-specific restriction endonuclease McrA
MVMRLPCPGVVNADLIDTVVSERQGGINAAYFTGIRDAWKARIQDYVVASGNPEIVKPWPGIDSHKKKYLNLYLSPQPNSVQAPILASLRSRTLQLCPACGEDGTPNTLDHYLPKEVYPEYAITPMNLFPMCDTCQGEKLTKTVTASNERLFLHPYFDQFAGSQVVVLRIGRPLEAPETIEITPHPGLTATDAALLARHLAELGIARRYSKFFRDEYIRLLRLAKSSRAKGQNVQQNLELFAEHALHKSPNSWGHIFYSGALADAELMEYLVGADLPAFV